MTSLKLTALLQYLDISISWRSVPTASARRDLPLLPAPKAPFAPTASADVVVCSPGPREHLKSFLSGPPYTLLRHSPARQSPSVPALLPLAGWGVARTMLRLGQQEVRPKGQQTEGSRPHTRTSWLRIQLCFHGNVQSHGSTVPSRALVAVVSALCCTAKSSCCSQPLPGAAGSDPLRASQSPAD